jgi:hypothetical protein
MSPNTMDDVLLNYVEDDKDREEVFPSDEDFIHIQRLKRVIELADVLS